MVSASLWFSQYRLMVIKNLKLKRRSKCGTCVECLFPIIVIIILIGFMQALLPKDSNRLIVAQYPPAGYWMSQPDNNVLLYAPNTTEINGLMDAFALLTTFSPRNDSTLKGFATNDEMQQWYLNNSDSVWAGVEFTPPDIAGNFQVEYAIRMDFFDMPDTKKQQDTDNGIEDTKSYLREGFVAIQLGIDSAVLASVTQATGSNITTLLTPSIREFNSPKDPLWKRYLRISSVFEILGAIFIIIALFTSNFRYLASIVAEKEGKIREEMRMMGLLPAVDNWAWFTTVMIITTLPVLIAGGILIGTFYHFSSPVTILFILFSELFSLYSLAVLVSLFANKAKFAGVLGFVVAIAFTILGVVVDSVGTNESVKLFLALLSPAAMVFANRGITASEKASVGTRTSNLSHKWRDDTPSVGAMIGFMYLDTILYAFIAWYIDNVFPGEFGIARPPWFFVTKRYWSDMLGLKDVPQDGLLANVEISDDVEAVNPELQDQAAVVIRKLRKTFKKGLGRKIAAVDGLNLTMYDGQITAFLGHNGAGKTTTISMLTGLIPSTGGDAFVRGYSIRTQMRQIRTTLGICPQHDVIWPELTVYDHLFIYAGLKGVPYKNIKRTVDDLIDEIGLTEKRLFQAGSLSGGQKRKLCLAMAFVGGSDVIFLDEPTSGMDPVTRRGVWDFLNANKKGRTIVLTTHFMDEADFLGDRVAIISHGQLRCAGSALFLKSRLGVGYLLVLSKTKACDPDKVTQMIIRDIPGATALSAFGGELQYRLPKESASHFPEFFAHLDANKEEIGIESYGVSLTTLEEVFLRIGMEERIEREEEDEKNQQEMTDLGKDQEKINIALAHETQGHRFGQQLRAQLVKRAVMYRRDVRGMLFTFFLPFAFLILSSAVIKNTSTININTDPPGPLPLTTALYAPRPYFYTGDLNWLAPNPLFANTTFYQHDAASFDSYIKNTYEGQAAGAYHLEGLGTDFNRLDNITTSYGVEFNKTLTHVVPAEIAFVDDALIRRFTGNISSVKVTSKPFPHVLTNVERAVSSIKPNLIYWSLIMLATFVLIPSGFVASIVQERVLNVKRLLSVSGASRSSYWASNFLWDWGMFLVLVIVAIFVVAAAGHDSFDSDAIGAIFFVFLLFSLFITAQSYVLSLCFKSYTIVTGALFAIHFIMALAFNIGYNIVVFSAVSNPAKWKGTVDRCFFAFNVISPQFGFISTLQRLAGFVSLYPKTDTWFTTHLVGFPLLMFTLHFFFWTALLLFIEYREQIAGKFKGGPKQRYGTMNVIPADEDGDVTAERNRLANDPNAVNDLVRVVGLRKEYPAPKGGIKVAVKNMTLGIPRSECFGLLGMNGAGKSTTLGAMSGDITPTLGDIWLNGYNLSTHPNDALRYFGWCPQFDALIGLLTGREQLTMYARIKGLEERVIPDTVTAFLQMLDLTQYANRPVKGYSGGNKRKLSLAVAMIGNPPIVFLDEPSTGMDPLARRYMWNVITALGANKSVVVTTHSMEECDALATRIGIMSQGELVCLGTSQHLKNRFASGYSLQVKAKPQYLDQLKAYISKAFPLAHVSDEHGDLLAYELPQNAGYKLAFIFAELQSQSTFLEDFSVSQTTLEQVFLKLAKEKAEGAKVDVVVV